MFRRERRITHRCWKGVFTNVNIENNYIGFSDYGGIAATSPGVTVGANVNIGYSNSSFSSAAWSAYLANGIVTNNLVAATGAGDNITGDATGSTTLYGDGTNEFLTGTANETIFVGGFGTQFLRGESGKNIFTYLSIANSTPQGQDTIQNFDPTKDVIDLSRIDADLSAAGIQNFTFIGTNAFTSAGGEVRYEQDPTTGETLVQAELAGNSLVGDAPVDFQIRLDGLLTLTAANFALTAAQSAAATAPAADVTSITDSAPGAALDAGKVVTLTVHFSGAVNVTGGVPTLSLNDGGTAVYASGSGTSALTFAYTVAAGQNTTALAITALSLQGATIRDNNGENAILTGAVTTLDPLQIDTTTPTVTSLAAKAASNDLNAGKTVALTVNFSQAVEVSGGTPSLTLNDGGTATYVGGSGSSALTFSYTVGAGQNTSNLTVAGLSLNGATIADNAGNLANLTNAKGGLGVALIVDTTTPTVSAVRTSPASGHEVTTGQLAEISLTMTEAVTVKGAPVLLLNDGATATYDKALSTATSLVFDYTVGKETTTGLAVTGIELPSGSSVADLAGNAAILSNPDTNTGLMVNTTKWAADASAVGNFTVGGSTGIELFGPSSANVTFAVGATGILTLDNSQSFAGTVAGLAQGQSIDLADIAYATSNSFTYSANSTGASGGELTLSNGTHSASIELLGSYLASSFATSSDGHGGTLLTDSAGLAHALLGASARS